MHSEPLLKVSGLSKSYGDLEVLKRIDFTVNKGEKIALIGPSGSGKSTCLRCINFLEKPTAGEIFLAGERVGSYTHKQQHKTMNDFQLAPQRAQMGMVFQSFNLWPHLSVLNNVTLAARKVQGLTKQVAEALGLEMLTKVHMQHKAEAYPSQLSGGQQQRVAIARALTQQPKLMLFDEPTSALDPELVHEVLNVIHELASEGCTMLLVTHEISFARDVADKVIFLDDGYIVEQGDAKQVINTPQHERTQHFLKQIRH